MNAHIPVAGLIYGRMEHYLDHLGPLCALLEIPLILSDPDLITLAKTYYPRLVVIAIEPILLPEYVVSHCDTILCCTPRALFDDLFFFAQQMLQKRISTIWCPHGNSDKASTSSFHMECLNKEEGAVLYGQQMIDILKEKKAFNQLKGSLLCGNYRFHYFKEHRAFYDTLARAHIARKLPAHHQTLLYAPTWQDHAHNSSLFDAATHLINTLSEQANLIIKLHPNLREQNEAHLETLLQTYQSHPRVLFLENYPPIYSLLSLCDLYIGDMSSIGYDFLAFDRPLFFLSQRDDLPVAPYLFQCGLTIVKQDYPNIHRLIDNFLQFELRDFSALRKKVYHYTFEPTPPPLKSQLQSLHATLLHSAPPCF